MATTVVAEDAGRAKPRLGDRVFSRLALVAGIAILAALAAVFIFLAIEGVPGLAKPAEFYGSASTFWGYVAPLLFGTVLAAVIALIVAVPLAWGIALVVSHYAPKRIATPIAYLIACQTYEDRAEADLVKGYLSYIVSDEGQQAASEEAGSAPLSSSVAEKAQGIVDAITAG